MLKKFKLYMQLFKQVNMISAIDYFNYSVIVYAH